MTTIDVELFRNTVCFTMTQRKWGNRRQGDLSGVDLGADKSRMKLTKQLIQSDEYNAIVTFQNDVYQWCIKRSNPTFFKDGLYLVKLSEVQAFEARLKEAVQTLREVLVPALVAAYPDQVDAARIALNGHFRQDDYPPADRLPERFEITWNWISFGVPENLPEELKQAEAAKIEKTFADAETQITAALREGFARVMEHLADRLTVQPGEKQKVFRDSLFEDVTEFVQTFNSRNMTNDSDLEALVAKANGILAQVRGDAPRDKAQLVRNDADLRAKSAAAFTELRNSVDSLIMSKPSRKFDLTEEAA